MNYRCVIHLLKPRRAGKAGVSARVPRARFLPVKQADVTVRVLLYGAHLSSSTTPRYHNNYVYQYYGYWELRTFGLQEEEHERILEVSDRVETDYKC